MPSKPSDWHIQPIWQILSALYQRLVTPSGRGNDDGRLEKRSNLKMALGFQQGHPIIREEAHNIERNDERTVREIMNGAEKTPRPTIAGESTMKFLAATTTKPTRTGASGLKMGCVVVGVGVDVGVARIWWWLCRCGARCGADVVLDVGMFVNDGNGNGISWRSQGYDQAD